MHFLRGCSTAYESSISPTHTVARTGELFPLFSHFALFAIAVRCARILLWAVVFKFEMLTVRMAGSVFIICGGLFMASLGEAEFSLAGLLEILGASCLSGLR